MIYLDYAASSPVDLEALDKFYYITKTYFANPFGPMQRSAQTDVLIHSYFNLLFKNGINVGEVYTKLAVPNEELRGPSNAAIALLKLIDN